MLTVTVRIMQIHLTIHNAQFSTILAGDDEAQFGSATINVVEVQDLSTGIARSHCEHHSTYGC